MKSKTWGFLIGVFLGVVAWIIYLVLNPIKCSGEDCLGLIFLIFIIVISSAILGSLGFLIGDLFSSKRMPWYFYLIILLLIALFSYLTAKTFFI